MKKTKEKHIALKLFTSILYIIAITILFVCSYNLYQEKEKVIPWREVNSVKDYTYIDIERMSEKFAYYEDTNTGVHFVIEKEETGLWHTYLVAINEDNYKNFKDIIDYTYERTDKKPESIRVYGYPVITDDNLKEMAIKNIENFLPAENEVVISNDNYEAYLTNSYLDTTIEKQEEFDIILFVTLGLLFTLVALLVITIFDKEKENNDKITQKKFKKYKKALK